MDEKVTKTATLAVTVLIQLVVFTVWLSRLGSRVEYAEQELERQRLIIARRGEIIGELRDRVLVLEIHQNQARVK